MTLPLNEDCTMTISKRNYDVRRRRRKVSSLSRHSRMLTPSRMAGFVTISFLYLCCIFTYSDAFCSSSSSFGRLEKRSRPMKFDSDAWILTELKSNSNSNCNGERFKNKKSSSAGVSSIEKVKRYMESSMHSKCIVDSKSKRGISNAGNRSLIGEVVASSIRQFASSSNVKGRKNAKEKVWCEEEMAHGPQPKSVKEVRGAIDNMIQGQNDGISKGMTAGDFPPYVGMGLLGEDNKAALAHIPSKPASGTVLISPQNFVEGREGNNEMDQYLSIRVSENSDDVKLADLRAKVFAKDFGVPTQMFSQRSCEMIGFRRKRGAVSLVASLPLKMQNSSMYKGSQELSRRQRNKERVVGCVELSVHEFYGTSLGYSRPAAKLLYVTEVAVSPNARRCGIGMRLLEVCQFIYFT